MGQEQLHLKQDVATRWNSTFYMLKRFIEVKDTVISTLALINTPLSPLSTEEWGIVRETVDIIKPFEEVTVEMSAERFVTASKVILIARGLQRIVARHQRNPSIHEPVQKLVDSLMAEMHKRFSKVEQIENLADATCLDPRFKKQAFVNNRAADDAVKRITAAAAAHNHPSHSEEEEEEGQYPAAAASAGAMFWEDFDDRVANTRASTSSDSATSSTLTASMMEMRAYIAEPLRPRTSDPLAWWRMCSPVFKNLCEVMKKRLCIVATSVPSERIFSKTGQIITGRRNRLSAPRSLKGQFHLNGIHKTGDVILGGLFAVNTISIDPDLSFTSEPQTSDCYGFDIVGFRLAQTMAFAIDEINRNSNLLPNVTLGYSLYDNCAQLGIGFRAALTLVSGQEEQVTLEENCVGTPPVLGIVGGASSRRSIAISTVLGLYSMPLVSYYATCSCLSDRKKFPSFFRTIPSDAFQVNAMIQILKHFGWTWAGLLINDSDYGFHAARSFHSDLGPVGGGCLAYTEILSRGDDPAEVRRIVDVMRKSTARVVIVFANNFMINLMKEVVRQNVTGLQWIVSAAWTSAAVLQTPHFMPYLGGTLGIAIRRGEIPGFRDFLLQIRPDPHHNNTVGNSMVNQFWEHTFQCRFAPPPAGWVETGGELCTGQEVIENVETDFLDVSNLRPEYNVYKAVYALAYALDDMLHCEPGRGPFSNDTCAHLQRMEPWQ
ncbi:extracellular calcium-sensing receptor-like, partial [Solea senegalensis]